ncbi:16S rRNA (uracil(1498)-N(3))-methyltransferase [Bremerella alba]|uniref:Ribosomal RNA small subunit methyltransferase E n=1 Tax=Bremerella alba TaxID=980252 RepID=A0A7V8V4H3_9BACT|nr:16S rRNA (uracil(1498)-N(3))-methyltransferase [Bremerella alba]MBA2114549.1 Ribosomal RNA small subunit methyltransferase E [Bremerella alba]
MSERFFIEHPSATEEVTFDEAESQHLAKVMRANVGDMVVGFDGKGTEFQIELTSVGKKKVVGTVRSQEEVSREASRRLTLAVALPKGDRQRWLVEKCVELGVARLVPLLTKRGVAQPVEKAIDRLRRAVIEASKQCERNHLMQVGQGQSLEEVLASRPAASFLLHPSGEAIHHDAIVPASEVLAIIGPEGGFTDEEVAEAAQHGCQVVSLGPRILRVETAALAMATLATAVPGP